MPRAQVSAWSQSWWTRAGPATIISWGHATCTHLRLDCAPHVHLQDLLHAIQCYVLSSFSAGDSAECLTIACCAGHHPHLPPRPEPAHGPGRPAGRQRLGGRAAAQHPAQQVRLLQPLSALLCPCTDLGNPAVSSSRAHHFPQPPSQGSRICSASSTSTAGQPPTAMQTASGCCAAAYRAAAHAHCQHAQAKQPACCGCAEMRCWMPLHLWGRQGMASWGAREPSISLGACQKVQFCAIAPIPDCRPDEAGLPLDCMN